MQRYIRISPDTEGGAEIRVLASRGPCSRTSALVLSTRTNKDSPTPYQHQLTRLRVSIKQPDLEDMQFNASFIGFTPNSVRVMELLLRGFLTPAAFTEWKLEKFVITARKLGKIAPKMRECVYEIHAAVVDSLQAPLIKMKFFDCSFSLSLHKHVYAAINEQIF